MKAINAMLFVLCVSASVSPAQSNYIYNGDFSAPITTTAKMLLLRNGQDWSVSTNNIVTWDTVNGRNAPGCMRIKADSVIPANRAGDVPGKVNRVIAPLTITGPEALALGAEKMQIRFWIRSDRPDGSNSMFFARCEAFMDHAPWTMVLPGGFQTYPLYNQGPGPCDPVWRECVMKPVPVTSNNVYNFHFLVNDTNSVILIDDITFTIAGTGNGGGKQ